MSEDARGEAEWVVKAVTHEAYKHGASVYGDLPAGVVNRDRDSEDRLVAALAAAIEVGDAGTSSIGHPEVWAEVVWPRLKALKDALSALRARAGEETG